MTPESIRNTHTLGEPIQLGGQESQREELLLQAEGGVRAPGSQVAATAQRKYAESAASLRVELERPVRSSHIVLTLGRSGSNTLVDMLNQNPALLNFGEVLGSWTQLRKVQRRLGLLKINDSEYLDWILGSRTFLSTANVVRTLGKIRNRRWGEIKSVREIESVGVKDFSLNLLASGLSGFLFARPGVKVVGLLRRNVIDRMISNETLEATGLVKLRNCEAPNGQPKIYVAPRSVLEKLTKIEAENIQLIEMLDALPQDRVLRMEYEQIFSSTEQTQEKARQIYEFLGVRDYQPNVRMRKILHTDPLLAVENSEEIRRVIADSRFEEYLRR